MPFKNMKQSKACFAQKAEGKAKGWNCKEWAEETNYNKLPEKAGFFMLDKGLLKAALAKIAETPSSPFIPSTSGRGLGNPGLGGALSSNGAGGSYGNDPEVLGAGGEYGAPGQAKGLGSPTRAGRATMGNEKTFSGRYPMGQNNAQQAKGPGNMPGVSVAQSPLPGGLTPIGNQMQMPKPQMPTSSPYLKPNPSSPPTAPTGNYPKQGASDTVDVEPESDFLPKPQTKIVRPSSFTKRPGKKNFSKMDKMAEVLKAVLNINTNQPIKKANYNFGAILGTLAATK